MTYYGRCYKSALYLTLRYVDRRLARRPWRNTNVCDGIGAKHWVREAALRDPKPFDHWPMQNWVTPER